LPDAHFAPPRRSDAERNRARILEAARRVLDDRHSTASMAEIARRAGVGMATLYRNFPSIRDLLESLYVNEVDDLCQAATEAAGDSGDALCAWLRQFAVFHENKHPIAAELLRHTDRDDPLFDTSRDRVVAAGRALLARAQEADEVRADLTIDQVLDLVLAVISVPGDKQYVEPILRAALDGLRV
jgi:AcrR family transcriptional regulator